MKSGTAGGGALRIRPDPERFAYAQLALPGGNPVGASQSVRVFSPAERRGERFPPSDQALRPAVHTNLRIGCTETHS